MSGSGYSSINTYSYYLQLNTDALNNLLYFFCNIVITFILSVLHQLYQEFGTLEVVEMLQCTKLIGFIPCNYSYITYIGILFGGLQHFFHGSIQSVLFFNNLAPLSTSEPPPGERTLPCLATEVAEDGVDEVALADDVQNQSNLRHLDHGAS